MEAGQELFRSTLNSAVQWVSTLEYLRTIWGKRGSTALSKFGSPTTSIKLTQNTCDPQAYPGLLHPNLGVVTAFAKFQGNSDTSYICKPPFKEASLKPQSSHQTQQWWSTFYQADKPSDLTGLG